MPPLGMAAALPDELIPDVKCGPWVVERELGRGGMGAVYAVHHEDIGKRAALKIVHGHLIGTGFNPDRMVLEAKVVNQVGHPGIVDIFETGQLADGRSYIVMERLEGKALSARCDEGVLPQALAIAVLEQISEALIAAHDAGIVHRDLKLDNVFLVACADSPHGLKTKLLDWGIAKVINTEVRNTIEGQLVGTPQYLAPEQARGHEVTAKTDVYSLGVMAYELLTDVLPFEAETAAETMTMHLRATPQPPRELVPTVLPQLEQLVLAMMQKAPCNRPTMREVLEQLRSAATEVDRQVQAQALAIATVTPGSAELAAHVAALSTPANTSLVALTPTGNDSRFANMGNLPTIATASTTGHSTRSPARRRWQYAVGMGSLSAALALAMFARGAEPTATATAATLTDGVAKLRAASGQGSGLAWAATGSRADVLGGFVAAPPVVATREVTAPGATPSATARSRSRKRVLLPPMAVASYEPIVVAPAGTVAPRPRAHTAIASARTATVALPVPARRAAPTAPGAARRMLDPDATVDAYR